jgi:signal transduction histidine kinase
VVLEQTVVDGVPEGELGLSGGGGGSTEALRLPPGKHRLEFRYTGLSFDAPERVRFRYRLEGLETDWVEAGTRRLAFYSFVPPGDYRFRVIACNWDGVWSENGASLALTVLPHFWETRWFLAVMGLGTVVVGAAAARIVEKRRAQRRLQRLEQERLLERERTRIAQDLHDMMGAKLCRISFLSENARRYQEVPPELREQITSMSDDSREVLQSLDEIVWAVNPQNDTLEHLASYLGQYAEEYFRRTGIDCELVIPPRLPIAPLSSQSRHHLFLAMHEALTNILKHSGATHARIAMACRGSDFEIAVTDNGRGFDPASGAVDGPGSSSGFGNGLENMRRRLAELGGRCRVESHPGKGTTVWLEFSLNGATRKVTA